MTQFDYILVSFVCMCITSAVNGSMAYADFNNGERAKGWISLALSALCGAAALSNLTQLVSM
mgnify:CR=1 FL=1